MGFISIFLFGLFFIFGLVGLLITKSLVILSLFLLALVGAAIGFFILNVSIIIITIFFAMVVGGVVTYYIVKAIMNKGRLKCPECDNYLDDESVICKHCGFRL